MTNDKCATEPCCCVASGELGIALSGGGARALAQVGVLKVLDRERIPVSYVAGTSAGAVIGAVYATSDTALQAEERILTHLATAGVGFNTATFEALAASNARRPSGLFAMLGTLRRAARPGGGLIGGDAMRASFRRLLGDATFADTRVRLAVTALDLITGRRVIFAEGSLVDAVYASSAIPGLFEPLQVGDHVLVYTVSVDPGVRVIRRIWLMVSGEDTVVLRLISDMTGGHSNMKQRQASHCWQTYAPRAHVCSNDYELAFPVQRAGKF